MRRVLLCIRSSFALSVALALGCGGSNGVQSGTSPIIAPPTIMPVTAGTGAGSVPPAMLPRAGNGVVTSPGASGSGAPLPPAGGNMMMGGAGMTGSAGMIATAGMTGAAGQPAGGSGAMPAPAGNMDPLVPMLTAECPEFRDGTISFMSLSGITVVAGAKAAGPTAPMVFYWHGTGSFAGEYAGSAAAVAQGVRTEGGVLISFQGTTGGDFTSGTSIFGAGDWKLADQLFACAVKNHNVDPRRVFATGCSAGGLFSTAMAAARSSYIAAVAPNSGGWSFPTAFQNKHVPALMTIHGAPGVDVVGLDFSQSSATADRAFKAAGGFVINCNHGGRHCGGGGLAPEIWQFFKAHPFGVDPFPWSGGLPAGFSSQCMIFK
jgi:hypothetical protein